MLIKSADDKSKRLALLEDLQKSSLLDNRQKTGCAMNCATRMQASKASALPRFTWTATTKTYKTMCCCATPELRVTRGYGTTGYMTQSLRKTDGSRLPGPSLAGA